LRSPETAPRALPLPVPAPQRKRMDGIDLVRGLVMVIMCLDHARDFLAAGIAMNPRDVHEPALFLTRWVTHFCAPVFVLLAGASAFLYGSRGRSKGELSRFLLTRGAWLILLELTIVRVAWTFHPTPDFIVLQVIWVIGASMIAMAALVHLPRWAIAMFALTLILGHNVFDGVTAERFGTLAWVWTLLHQPAVLDLGGGVRLLALYPLIPWVGVMAAGYALGPVFQLDGKQRAATLAAMGCAITLGFVTLRVTNLYGDPQPWAPQHGLLPTLLALLNCEKYPPSLLYLSMTLGPALIVLSAAETFRGRVAAILVTFGRVPMLYYVAHLFLLHLIAIVVWQVTAGDVGWLFESLPDAKPASGGFGLPGIYAAWLLAVAVLYPLCRWFARVKRERRDWWLSYL
jgi:uncharacterized membrane protein